MEQDVPNRPAAKLKLTWSLVLVIVASGFGSSFQNGYHFWVIHYPNMFIVNFYGESYWKKNSNDVPQKMLKHLWHFNISFFPLGGIIGTLFIYFLADHFGRKTTLLINSIFAIISTILMACSKVSQTYEFVVFAHMVVGVCAGISSIVVPLYLAEVAPHTLRGGIVLVDRLFFTTGIFVAQLFSGLQKALGNKEDWIIMVSLTGFPALVQIILLPFCPESPRYLLIQKRDEEKTKQVLQKLRGWDEIEGDIEELYDEDLCDDPEKHMSPLKLVSFSALRCHLFSDIVLITSHQLSGIHLVYFYMEMVYTSVGIKLQDISYITTPVTALLIIVTFVLIFMIDCGGRKFPLLLGLGICSIACVSLTVSLKLQRTNPWMSYFSTVFIIIFLCGQAIGPGPIPILISIELFLQSSRASATSVVGFVHWTLCFVLDLLLHVLVENFTSYGFIFSFLVSIATFYYVVKFIPETKKLTFLDIRNLLVNKETERILASGPEGT